MDQRFYSEDEAEQILKQAVRIDPAAGQVSRERLIEMANEVGVTPEAILLAEREVTEEKVRQAEEAKLVELREEFLEERKAKRRSRFGNWIGMSVMLGGINFVTDRGNWWSLIPIGIVGAFTVANYIKTIFNTSGTEAEFQKWVKRRKSSDQDAYVRNSRAEKLLDDYYAVAPRDNKLEAIKFVRAELGIELDEAKEAVENYQRLRGW